MIKIKVQAPLSTTSMQSNTEEIASGSLASRRCVMRSAMTTFQKARDGSLKAFSNLSRASRIQCDLLLMTKSFWLVIPGLMLRRA